MTAQLTCPACGCVGDPEVFVTEAANARALVAALRLPAMLSGPILDYLRLHNPPNKAMAARKRERLLSELQAHVNSGEVNHNGITHAAPGELWRQALEKVSSSPPKELPLNGHGYLLRVVAGMASSAAGQQERQREEQARNRVRTGPVTGPKPAGAFIAQAAPEKTERKGPPPGWKDAALGRRGGDTDG